MAINPKGKYNNLKSLLPFNHRDSSLNQIIFIGQQWLKTRILLLPKNACF